MSGQIGLCEMLTLIEENAHAARVHFADAALLSSQMDIRSGQAKARGDESLMAIRNLTAFLHQKQEPPKIVG